MIHSLLPSYLLDEKGRGTAWAVWDGATAIALYLDCLLKSEENQPPWLQNLIHGDNNNQPLTIIELGSGTGLAGLAAAAAFHQQKENLRVILTDLAEALPALQNNVAANDPFLQNLITVTECDWFNPNVDILFKIKTPIVEDTQNTEKNQINLIIAADCVWLEDLVLHFVATLEELIRKGGSIETRVLLGYQSRSQRIDDLLFGLLRENFRIDEAEMLAEEKYGRGKIEISWLSPLPCLLLDTK
jgi:protein N-lysine methyltransferase METTL21C